MRVMALQLLIQRLKRLGHVCEHKRPLKGCSALWRAYAALVAGRDAFATALQRNCTEAGRVAATVRAAVAGGATAAGMVAATGSAVETVGARNSKARQVTGSALVFRPPR